jgi:aryl-alcohol dehydrogenase-like predicted oxidoreductase
MTHQGLSALTFGTWQIGGANFGPVTVSDAVGLLRAAFDNGITSFDTSNVYGNGRSEVLIGLALASVRDQCFLITKAGYLTGIDGVQAHLTEIPQLFDEASILRSCDDSLRRLCTDHVDAFLLHDPSDEVMESGASWELLARIQQSGRARYVGVSASPRKCAAALARGVGAVEVRLSRAHPEAAETTLPAAAAAAGLVFARSPFDNGKAFGALGAGDRVARVNRAAEMLSYPLGLNGVSSVVLGIQSAPELVEDVEAWKGLHR